MNMTNTTRQKKVPTSAYRHGKEVCTLCESDSSRFYRSTLFGVLVCRVCSNGTYQDHYGDSMLEVVRKEVA